MYTLSSWRNHLGGVGVVFLPPEPARTVVDPFTAYVPGEVTQLSRMTDVHPKFQEKYLSSVGVDLLHQEPASTVGDTFTA